MLRIVYYIQQNKYRNIFCKLHFDRQITLVRVSFRSVGARIILTKPDSLIRDWNLYTHA
jgi:hypothetical protein